MPYYKNQQTVSNILKSPYYLILLFIFVVSHTKAQPEKNRKELQALNLYVDFVNQNIETLTHFHNKFSRFGLRLNQYYHKVPKDSLGRAKSGFKLRFSENPNGISLSSLYEKTTKSDGILPEKLKSSLNTSADKLMESIRQILTINQELESYVNKADYCPDNQLDIAYKLLSQSRVLFYDFAISKDELESEINPAYSAFSKNPAQSNYKKELQFWQENLVTSKAFLYGIKKNFPAEVETATANLKKNLTRLSELQKEFKKQKKKESKSTYKLFLAQSEELEKQLNALITLGNKIQKQVSSEKLPSLSNPNKTFHEEVLPVYNEMVGDYDKLNGLVLGDFPNKMKEVPWLQVNKPSAEIILNSESSPLANALPNNLIFLLDVSGSMELPERLPLLKEAVNYLVKQMRPIDKISIVTYSGEAKIVLPSISASENEVVSKSLKKLKSKGESNALAGLQLAYEELSRNFIENGNNRIVIATDGGIQVNKTLLELTKENALNRKYISVFYFGNKEVRHKLQLESLAKSGFGNYVRITPENIQEKLIEEANSN
jgi:hypothetical protein